MREAASCKEEANRLFNLSKYNEAVARYEESLLACPIYLHYELAVLKSNLAACYLKLEQWKEAIKEASSALKSLDKCEHDDSADDEKEKDKSDTSKIEANAISVSETGQSGNDDSDIEEVIVSEGASKAGPAVVTPVADDDKAQDPEAARRKRKEDIKRIRCKSLLRRARARCQVGGWSNLSGAEEDYKAILAITTTMEDSSSLPPAEKRRVERQLCELPPKIKAAQEKETAEMWAKLKDVSNLRQVLIGTGSPAKNLIPYPLFICPLLFPLY